MIDWASPKLRVSIKMLWMELYFYVCVLPKTLKSHKERKKKKNLEIKMYGHWDEIRHNDMTILNKLK